CFLSANKSPCAHGVFVTNSKVFLVADFFEKNNIRNVQLIGYDLLDSNIDHLKKGNIRFLIGQKPVDQGYKSLMTLFNALFMKKKIQQDQYLPIDIITKENLDFYLHHKK
ncbi:MAG: substrate-binding domain-containing protein, partial [Bacteroidota bacterium]